MELPSPGYTLPLLPVDSVRTFDRHATHRISGMNRGAKRSKGPIDVANTLKLRWKFYDTFDLKKALGVAYGWVN